MVVVYAYRDDGADGLELKYSIRSITKYFTDFTDLILVTNPGQVPSWYAGKVIEYSDIEGKPAASIVAKILAGSSMLPVLWCADDHFALKPFDKNLPNYYNYHARQVDARIKKMIGNCPSDWLNYICHTPMVMDPVKLHAAITWAAGREFPIKTLYANFNKLPGTVLQDCKFRGIVPYHEIKARILKRPFFSTHENAMLPDMIKVMDELYPEKSIFEI